MRSFGFAVLASLIAVSCLGQGNTYGSYTGFGRVIFPGTGHPPLNPPGAITDMGFANRLGATLQGRPVGGYRGGGYRGRGWGQGAVLVPYPVFSGYTSEYPYDGQDPQAAAPAAPAPTVIINQTFVSERANPMVRTYSELPQSPGQSGLQSYQAPGPPPAETRAAAQSDDQPTLYLIAFRDHTIVPALAYWTEGNTLKYVNVDHSLNQATLDLIDRGLSQTLNQQRNIEFKLPAH